MDLSCFLLDPKYRRNLTPFKAILSRAKNRKKFCNLTLDDICDQWEKQKGRCCYTGWLLKLPKNSYERLPKTPDRASLDRIDSSLGYTVDNIQFVSLAIQYAKHNWSETEFFKFIHDASDYIITHP